MRKIPLTKDKFALVDDEDYSWLSQWKWHVQGREGGWYAQRNTPRSWGQGRRKVLMHRAILGLSRNGPHVDHRNGDGLDNQRRNLRPCTASENQMSQRPQRGASSRFKGVSWHKRDLTWRASIKVAGVCVNLGYFSDEEDAARAYDDAAREHFGGFALPNFQESDPDQGVLRLEGA